MMNISAETLKNLMVAGTMVIDAYIWLKNQKIV